MYNVRQLGHQAIKWVTCIHSCFHWFGTKSIKIDQEAAEL